MSRQIRFSEIVKNSGKPETATLWGPPMKGDAFSNAVRENRVLTILHNRSRGKVDVAEIGFHQEPSALYLVFPKPLPKDPKARIVGIKYDLLQEAKVPAGERVLIGKPKPPDPKPAKVISFRVTVTRTAKTTVELQVVAEDAAHASAEALESLRKERFNPGTAKIEDEVILVKKDT